MKSYYYDARFDTEVPTREGNHFIESSGVVEARDIRGAVDWILGSTTLRISTLRFFEEVDIIEIMNAEFLRRRDRT